MTDSGTSQIGGRKMKDGLSVNAEKFSTFDYLYKNAGSLSVRTQRKHAVMAKIQVFQSCFESSARRLVTNTI